MYRDRVQTLGLGFRPVRSDCLWLNDEAAVRRMSHPRKGLVRVVRDLLMPAIDKAYEDTLAAVKGADLLFAMTACFAARLVAEKQSTPWVSALHIPIGFLLRSRSPRA